MTDARPKDPRRNFVPRFLPWLLGVATLILYAATLNPWVTPGNGPKVAELSGWSWQPEVTNPFSHLATYPLRWVAVASIPFAVNLFSAICAALTLGLLARSVAILPQDRTEAQRKREKSDFSFLTTTTAWLPPLIAVVVCGLQMTFWENATNYTGEMFDLLVFAFIVWSLLEYRLDERPWRLFLAAAVYGAGMTDNYAMIGFLPVFIGAVIWVRGLSFFRLRFIGLMFLCGLAGLSLYFLLPAIAAAHDTPLTFWMTYKFNLTSQAGVIKAFFLNSDLRQKVGLLSLTSLLPVLLLSIRWKSSFGDSSRIGSALTSFIFHLVHVVFFGACIWVAFDPPFSPRHLGFGIPFLTFYYMAALAVGYFCGYLLLVFGKAPSPGRNTSHAPTPSWQKGLNRLIFAGVWIVSAGAIAGLLYKNLPQIRTANNHSMENYARRLVANLPASGGYALSDDPQHSILAQAMLTREGRARQYIVLDTVSLPWPHYQRYLHAKYKDRWPQIVSDKQQDQLNPIGLIAILTLLSKTNDLYYLHPSAGYYFEQFYAEPHGLVYKLRDLPNDTLIPPPLDKAVIAENETFWADTATAFAPILKANAPADPGAKKSLADKIFIRLHISKEPDATTALLGGQYSKALNDWGVALQQNGDWTNAAKAFALAGELNPDNVAASVNLQFNHDVTAGKGAQEDLVHTLPDPFGRFGALGMAINEYGSFDVPSYNFLRGSAFVQMTLRRQAVAPFARALALQPDNATLQITLAQLYAINQLPDRALAVLKGLLADPEKFGLTATNLTPAKLLAAGAYLQKGDLARGFALMEDELRLHPDNNDLFTSAMQAYVVRGMFTNALAVAERRLKLTPDDPAVIFSKGYVSFRLNRFDVAIDSFSRVLTLQPDNPEALFNRALACLSARKIDAARADFEKLEQLSPNSIQAAFGLGEIAWREHDTNAAIEHYQAYLTGADTNTSEAQLVIQRLQQLKGQPH